MFCRESVPPGLGAADEKKGETIMEKRFLVLPVNDAHEAEPWFLRSGDRLLQDIAAAVDPENPVFEAYVDITRFGEVPMTLTNRAGKEIPVRIADRMPLPEEIPNWGRLRPAGHFTTRLGWINDPNGLVYADGLYHMFYQHNPAGWRWGNMTWGHAVSQDLMHWDEWGDAIFPDELGTMFSGSAVVDERNVSGLGAGAILRFYTAAGSTSDLSKDQPSTQCMAWSNDGGRTFRKYDKNPLITSLAPGNRDPKVQWAEELGKYTLSIFLIDHDYMMFTSDDLIHWTPFQKLDMPLDGECPDFYPLVSEQGQRKWVFSGASDTYLVGDLDKDGFHADQEALRYQMKPGISYAAQTFSGTGDRRIKLYWEQVTPEGALFNSQMSMPMEVTLTKVGDLWRLRQLPSPEWDRLLKAEEVLNVTGSGRQVLKDTGAALDVQVEIPENCPAFTVSCRNMDVQVDPAKGVYTHGECEAPLSYDGKRCLRLIFDNLSADVFADDGLIYTAFKAEPIGDAPLAICSEAPVSLKVTLRELA